MTVFSFGSFEEMQEHLRKQHEVAMAQIKDFQRPIADGKKHYYLRLVSYGPQEPPLLITGFTHDLEEHDAAMKAKYVRDAESQQEHDWELTEMRRRLADGYVFCRSFSVAEPEGELGDVHISVMLEIPEEIFQALVESRFELGEVARRDHPARPYLKQWLRQVAFQ